MAATVTTTPRTSIQPSQNTSATSLVNATRPTTSQSFLYDGQTVNPNQTATEANNELMKEIIGEGQQSASAQAAAVDGGTFAAGGFLYSTVDGSVVGIDATSQSQSATNAVQARADGAGETFARSGGNIDAKRSIQRLREA